MHIEIYTAESLVPGPSHLEVKFAITKLKKCKSPGSDQILAEVIQSRGETLVSLIQKFITLIIIMGYHCYQLPSNILSNIHLSRLIPFTDEIIGF
jgi:hypothetical protein